MVQNNSRRGAQSKKKEGRTRSKIEFNCETWGTKSSEIINWQDYKQSIKKPKANVDERWEKKSEYKDRELKSD